ncbi:hypothetical protein [Anaerorhabdus sp.]|jgi:hypothetical protein
MKSTLNWIINQILHIARSNLLSTSRSGVFQEDSRELRKKWSN